MSNSANEFHINYINILKIIIFPKKKKKNWRLFFLLVGFKLEEIPSSDVVLWGKRNLKQNQSKIQKLTQWIYMYICACNQQQKDINKNLLKITKFLKTLVSLLEIKRCWSTKLNCSKIIKSLDGAAVQWGKNRWWSLWPVARCRIEWGRTTLFYYYFKLYSYFFILLILFLICLVMVMVGVG